MSNVAFQIPEDIWEDASDSGQSTVEGEDLSNRKDFTRTRLYTSIHLNNVLYHCEAIEATLDEAGDRNFKAVNPAWEDTLTEYYIACSAEGPMNTVSIAGREYVIFITPSCR